jgi:hypothetical protein
MKNDNVLVKNSIRKVTTTSKKDIKYDSLGNIFSYKEISFLGDEVSLGNNNCVKWLGLTNAEKSAIFTQQVTATLEKDTGITINKVICSKYNSNHQLIYEKRNITQIQSDQKTILNVINDKMEYDGKGNLINYRRATYDTNSGKITKEETISDTKYDDNKRNVGSYIKYTETYENDNTYYNEYTVLTKDVIYNDLNQVIKNTKITTKDNSVVIETAEKPTLYNEKGSIMYSCTKIIETSLDEYNECEDSLENIEGKINYQELYDCTYNSRGLANSYVKTIYDEKKINYTIEFCLNTTYDTNKRMQTKNSKIIKLGQPNGELYYTTLYENINILAYNKYDQILQSKNETISGNKTTTQTTIEDLKYENGDLTASKYEIKEEWFEKIMMGIF